MKTEKLKKNTVKESINELIDVFTETNDKVFEQIVNYVIELDFTDYELKKAVKNAIFTISRKNLFIADIVKDKWLNEMNNKIPKSESEYIPGTNIPLGVNEWIENGKRFYKTSGGVVYECPMDAPRRCRDTHYWNGLTWFQ